jgi:hypothetical protein
MELKGNEDGSKGFQIAPFPAGREILGENVIDIDKKNDFIIFFHQITNREVLKIQRRLDHPVRPLENDKN